MSVAPLNAGTLRFAHRLGTISDNSRQSWHQVVMTTGVYTSKQIMQLTGVGIRTFRHWIGQGILASPHGRGPAARYGEDQLTRVRAVQALRAQGAGLDEIKRRISAMTPQEMAALVPAAQNETQAPQPGVAAVATAANTTSVATSAASDAQSPVSYRGAPWEMIELMPGLILMIGQNRGDVVRRLANEIWLRYGSAVR